MEPNGDLVRVETPGPGEGFAGDLIRYAPRQLRLEPGRPQTIRILYRRPGELAEGEYRSHLLFQEIPKVAPTPAQGEGPSGLNMQISALFGISIPVIVRHGDLEASARLTENASSDRS